MIFLYFSLWFVGYIYISWLAEEINMVASSINVNKCHHAPSSFLKRTFVECTPSQSQSHSHYHDIPVSNPPKHPKSKMMNGPHKKMQFLVPLVPFSKSFQRCFQHQKRSPARLMMPHFAWSTCVWDVQWTLCKAIPSHPCRELGIFGPETVFPSIYGESGVEALKKKKSRLNLGVPLLELFRDV